MQQAKSTHPGSATLSSPDAPAQVSLHSSFTLQVVCSSKGQSGQSGSYTICTTSTGSGSREARKVKSKGPSISLLMSTAFILASIQALSPTRSSTTTGEQPQTALHQTTPATYASYAVFVMSVLPYLLALHAEAYRRSDPLHLVFAGCGTSLALLWHIMLVGDLAKSAMSA